MTCYHPTTTYYLTLVWMSVLRVHDNKQTAELAAQFNEFYFQITLSTVTQIGNYRIIDEIGEGAFGKVYLAQHLILGTQVVLKCGLLDDPNIVREIYYHRQLRHKNIVKLYEVIRTESHLWMALEYCEGLELYYYIYEKRRLSIDVCRHLFYQIVDGIKYVHLLNLSHRDLKLENILLADKHKSVIKLTDFGFVREFNPNKRQFLSTVCGTTSYMAPEVLKNEKYSGFAVDIWALGVVLYAMLYGELPFDEDDELKTKYKIIHEEPVYREFVGAETIALLRRMLCKDPWARPLLTEIFNLPFLVDITNQKTEKNPVCNDAESVLSISQHYKRNMMPFQSKTEKHLLKKLEKLDVDTEGLQAAVFAGQTNSLTAFYELALTQEFRRKKSRYLKRERYYEAKRQLKKLRKLMRSALSLDQTTGSQPLERIISSLSLLSRAENASRNNLRTSDEVRKPSTSRTSAQTPLDTQNDTTAEYNTEKSQGPQNTSPRLSFAVPFRQSVSFHSDDHTASIASSTQLRRSRLLGRLQFWRRPHREMVNNGSFDSAEHIHASDPHSQNTSPASPQRQSAETSEPHFLEDHRRDVSGNTIPLALSIDPPHMQMSASHDSYIRRARPESVVSQVSQVSQLSQFPMSESELDMLDGTDLDEDDYYDDAVYELSINTSQQDLSHKTSSQPLSQSSSKKKRPHTSSGVLDGLLSSNKKKYSLSQVSSNSSDESSARSKLIERFFDESAPPTRPISPRTKIARKSHPKLRSLKSASPRFATGPVHTPQPVVPTYSGSNGVARPQSPPILRMKKRGEQMNGLANGAHSAFSRGPSGASSMNGSMNGTMNGSMNTWDSLSGATTSIQGTINGTGLGINGVNTNFGNAFGNGVFDTIQVDNRAWKRENGPSTRRFEFINEEEEEDDEE